FICGENNEHIDERPAHGKNRQLMQAARVHFSIERDLRRSERPLGLRPAWRRAKAQPEELLVARDGARTRRRRGHGWRNPYAFRSSQGFGTRWRVFRSDGRLFANGEKVSCRPD